MFIRSKNFEYTTEPHITHTPCYKNVKIIQMKKKKLEYTEEMLEDLKNFKSEDIQSAEKEKVEELKKIVDKDELLKFFKIKNS